MASGDKFCWSCGSSLLAKDIFCRECGADLRKDEPLAQDTQDKPTPAKEQEPKTVKTTPKEKVPMVSPTEDSLPVMDDPPATADAGAQASPINSSQTSVGFFQAIKLGFKHYADFNGRATRPEFWWWWLFTGLTFPLFWITLIPSLAVTARRLRDANHSLGWMLIAPIPGLGLVVMILCCGDTVVVEDQAPPVSGTSEDEKVERAASLEAKAKDDKLIAEQENQSEGETVHERPSPLGMFLLLTFVLGTIGGLYFLIF